MKNIRGFIIILLLLCVFMLSSCNIADILPPVDNTDPPVTQDPSGGEKPDIGEDPSGNSTTVCNHSYGEWQIVNPATCEQQGLQERVCTLCTERQEEVIPLTAHTEVTDAAVEATCSQTGLTEGKHCSVCHTVLTTQTEVPMKPHSEVTDAAVEATCTQTGLTEGKHCSVCHTVLTAQTVVPMKHHSEITDAAVEATCTQTGLTEGKHCSVCHTVLTAQTVVPMKPHTEVTDAAVEATCTQTGLTEGKHCSVCHTVLTAQTVVPMKPHTEVTDAAVEATCTQAGLTEGKHCSACGEVLTAQTVTPALDHTYDDIYDATCNRCGHVREAQCAHLQLTVLPAIPATCQSTGLTEGKQCAACGHVVTPQQIIPLADHTEVTDAAVEATCTQTGLTEGKHCSVCHTVLTAQTVVPMKPHTEVTDAAVEATCTQTGLTEGKHCSACGEVLTAQTVTPALDHTYDDIYDATCNRCGHVREAQCAHLQLTILPAIPATCQSTGLTEGKQCAACGHVVTPQQIIPLADHTEVTDAAVEATCTQTGLTEGKHCSACGKVLVAQTVTAIIPHNMVNGACSMCGYQVSSIDPDQLASHHSYDYLGTLQKGTALQAFYRRLNDTAKAFHTDATYNAPPASGHSIGALPAVSYSDLGLTYDEATTVYMMFKDDHPLYYWISNTWYYSSQGGWLQMCSVQAYANGEDRAYYNALLYQAIAQYREHVAGETSPYLITLAYHDLIIENICYAYKADGVTPSDSPSAHSIIGTFLDKIAVCEGYSKALQLLLNSHGIENVYVRGSANGAHAWNLVQLDDERWYWVDSTWDDQPSCSGGIVHNYFAVTDAQLVDWRDTTHGWDEPQSGTTSFIQTHSPHLPNASYFEYRLAALPERSDRLFVDGSILELRETFTVGNLTYTMVGYRKVQLVSVHSTQDLVIPETVTYNGTVYSVVAVGAIDENGYLTAKKSIFVDDITQSITLPASLHTIGMGAFQYASALQRVTVAQGTTTLDHFSFVVCTSLREIVIPKSVTFIGVQTFAYCFNLTSITFEGTCAEWQAIEKGQLWDQAIPSYVVHCSDGDIVK